MARMRPRLQTPRCWSASARRSTSTPASCRRRRRRCSASGSSGCSGCAQEPRRLWRRYLRYNPRFVCGLRSPVHAAPHGTLSGMRAGRRAGCRAAGPPSRHRVGRRLRRQPGDRVARGRRRLGLRARAPTATMLERHWTGSGWTDWRSLGGSATSGPAAVGYGKSILVFVRGTDGAIYQNDVSTTRPGRAGRHSAAYATSAPAAALRRGPEGYVDLAVKGGDNAIYLRTLRTRATGGTGWGLARRQPDVGAGAELAVRRAR